MSTLAPIRLPYRFVSIQGDDAERFLQGQLSCDLSQLTESQACYGTANSPKGRMYGLLRIVRWKEGFLMRLHESTLDNFLQQLGKYKVFFKCQMQAENHLAYGYMEAPETSASLPSETDAMTCDDHGTLFLRQADPTGRYECWSPAGLPDAVSDPASCEAWHIAECRQGIPELYAETVDHFILQHLNLQQLGAVSFKKGCYTGQEIIARMKFLGKLKKKMFLLYADADHALTPGLSVYDENDKKCGEIVRGHRLENGESIALAVLDIRFDDTGGTVHTEQHPAVPFQVESLPEQA